MKHHRYAGFLGFTLAISSSALVAKAEPWAAVSGVHGAGLGLRDDANVRAWTDVAFGHIEDYTYLSPLFGVGGRVAPEVEIEAVLPLASAIGDNGDTIVGNIFLGASYLLEGPSLRLKVGGGIGLPILSIDDFSELNPLAGAVATRALQEPWFWLADAVPIVIPLHLEAPVDSPAVFTLDAAAIVVAPVRERNDTDLFVQVAPGIGGYLSDSVLAGTRVTLAVIATNDIDDRAQVAIEPFLRFHSDAMFLSTRFTVNLDEPFGFAFDDGKAWGLHVGLGGAF